jgi:RNA polymerase sigma factor (sigma-70 family)
MKDTLDSIAEIYQAHAGHVFRRARQLLGSNADADEVVQDVFLSLFERPEQYRGLAKLTTFLYSATTHACLNRLRNQKARNRLVEENLTPLQGQASGMTAERRLELHGLLRRMPEDWARAAIYHYMDDLTQDDIARLMDCSRKHVGHLLARIATWLQTEGEQHVG